MNQKGLAPILVLFGIVALISVTSGAYFLGARNKHNTGVTNQIESSPTPATSSIKNNAVSQALNSAEAANWQIFTNEDYNYSIAYPPSVELTMDKFHLIGDKNRKDTADGFGPNLSLLYRGESTSEEAASNELPNNIQEKFAVNNAKGVKVGDFDYYVQKDTGEGPVIRIIFNSQDYSGEISKEKIQEMRPISEKMLGTFKFSDNDKISAYFNIVDKNGKSFKPDKAWWYYPPKEGEAIEYPAKCINSNCTRWGVVTSGADQIIYVGASSKRTPPNNKYCMFTAYSTSPVDLSRDSVPEVTLVLEENEACY